jgi:CDP-diacylglycerol---glycerol-3-phosphate 3-phosphatidyltransferase
MFEGTDMLNALARGGVSRVTDPVGRSLLRLGLSPDLVTVIGTVGAVAASISLFPTGHLFWGTVAVTVFVFFDLFDGAMARARGFGTRFGLVLDASCDRIADGALFGSLAYYCFVTKDDPTLAVACLIVLVAGQVISYVKARADSVDLHVGGALAERAERNVLGLVGAGLAGLGLPLALPICLWLLAAACLVTVVQRLVQVRAAASAAEPPGQEDRPGQSGPPEQAGEAGSGQAGPGPASGLHR